MKNSCLLLLFAFTWFTSSAQTVPDTALAQLIATACPACISGHQLQPVAQSLRTLRLSSPAMVAVRSTAGLEYFTALDTLTMDLDSIVGVDSLPPALSYLHINNLGDNGLWLGLINFNSGLKYLYLSGIITEGMTAFPDSLEVLVLNRVRDEGWYFPCLPRGLDTLRNISDEVMLVPNFPRRTVVEGLVELSPRPWQICLDSTISLSFNFFEDKNCNGRYDNDENDIQGVKFEVQPGGIILDDFTRSLIVNSNQTFIVSILPPEDKNYRFQTGDVITYTTGNTVDTFIYLSVPVCAIPPAVSTVMGRIYYDENKNFSKDSNEYYLPEIMLRVDTGNIKIMTDASGKFSFTGDTSAMLSIDLLPPLAANWHLAYGTINVELPHVIDSMLDLGELPLWESRDVFDGALELQRLGGTRRTATLTHIVQIKNSGTNTLKGKLVLRINNWKYNNFHTFLPPPDDIVQQGDDFVFTYENIEILPGLTAKFSLMGDLLQAAGMDIYAHARFETESGLRLDDELRFTVSAPYDPNNIRVNTERISLNYIHEKKYLYYTINFQNIGNDTAYRVRILDHIPEGIRLNELELIAASDSVALARSYFSPADKILIWEFDQIYLPPANRDSLGSMGYLTYRVSIDTALRPGDEIKHFADILFDAELAVRTDTAVTIYYCPQMDGVRFAEIIFTDFNCPDDVARVEIQRNMSLNGLYPYWSDGVGGLWQRVFDQSGVYNLIIVDDALCRESYRFELTKPDTLEFTHSLLADSLIRLTITGGTSPYHIQWLDSGTEGEYLVVHSDGVYHFEAIDFNGCVLRDSVVITGLKANVLQHKNIFIYPSPVHQSVYISGADLAAISGYQISDARGKVLVADKKAGVKSINVSSLAPGIYYLGLEFKEGVKWIRFIKI